MSINKKDIKLLIALLESARQANTMENASFDVFGHVMPVITSQINEDKREVGVTNFIREKTKLYRNTWVQHPIDRVLEYLQRELKGERMTMTERLDLEDLRRIYVEYATFPKG